MAMFMAISTTGDHASEIGKLTSEVSRLSGKVDWWNSAIIVMMVIAAIAATGLVVTQYIAFRQASQLSAAQDRLEKAKERESGEAIAFLNSAAEELRSRNLTLEAQLQPRSLSVKQQKEIGDSLNHWKNRVVTIRWTDPESYKFSLQLEAALRHGGLDARPFGYSTSSNGRMYTAFVETRTGVLLNLSPHDKFAIQLEHALRGIGQVKELRFGSDENTPPADIVVLPKPYALVKEDHHNDNTEGAPN